MGFGVRSKCWLIQTWGFKTGNSHIFASEFLVFGHKLSKFTVAVQ